MEKFTVKAGIATLEKRMTKKQALYYGNRYMPADLRKAGFVCTIFESDVEIHFSKFLRINYGK